MHRPYATHYRVKKGDSLSRIALFEYGDGRAWPPIAMANGMIAPYRLVVGMVLRLPTLGEIGYKDSDLPHLRQGQCSPGNSGQQQAPPAAPAAPQLLKPATAVTQPPARETVSADHFANSRANTHFGDVKAKDIKFPALKFPLEKWLPKTTMTNGSVDISIKFTGEVTLQQEGTLTTLELADGDIKKASIKGPNGEVEFSGEGETVAKINKTYKSKLFDLGSSVQANWNPTTNEAKISCGFSIAAKSNGQVFATSIYKVIPPSTFEYTYEPAPVKGKSGEFEFEGKVGFVMDVTTRDNAGKSDGRAFVYVGAAGLAIAGVAIIVVDIISDVFPPDIAKSPLTWSAAMALFARAGAMLAPRAVMMAPALVAP